MTLRIEADGERIVMPGTEEISLRSEDDIEADEEESTRKKNLRRNRIIAANLFLQHTKFRGVLQSIPSHQSVPPKFGRLPLEVYPQCG